MPGQNINKNPDKLITPHTEFTFQMGDRGKLEAELILVKRKLILQNDELILQNSEKEKRAAELLLANKELVFQNEEKEKLAAELIISNKELIFQNEEKEKQALRLIASNKQFEQFAYIASHDLQEPLRTVSNYMRVLEEDCAALLDDKARSYIHSVNNATKKMSALIKSLLDFSRLGLNKKLTQVDCKKLINEVISDLDSIIKTSNAIIEVTEMPALNAYEAELRQVFLHLITNAIKFHKKGVSPKIRIYAEKVNENWKFSIKDNGIGIAPAYFERIFDIFQRLNSNEKGYTGNGIGLANCKKIIQLHEGKIWVESNPGQGTTFYFTIPNLIP